MQCKMVAKGQRKRKGEGQEKKLERVIARKEDQILAYVHAPN